MEARKKLSGKWSGRIFFALGTTLPQFYNPGQASWLRWADGSSPSPRDGQVASSGAS